MLPIALLRAREAVIASVRTILSEEGVTEAQWHVMRVIHQAGRLGPAATAKRACVLLRSLTRIVRDLEKLRLLAKTPHERDGHTFWLSVTEQGEALIDRHLEKSEHVFEELQKRFGLERSDQFLELLDDLARSKT